MLSAAHVEQFEADGFLVLPDFLSPATLDSLRAAYDAVLDGSAPAAGDRMLGGITRQVMLPSNAHAAFDRNPAVRAGFDMARAIYRTNEVFRLFDMLIYKPAGHEHETPWHQDMSYLVEPVTPKGTPIIDSNIQVWIALDDADEDNGCMQFVPGCHRQPMYEHVVASGDPTDQGRLLAMADPERDVDLSTKVVAAVPAGGATIHGSGTPHYTGPNRTADRPRRAYIFNVAAKR